MAQFTVIDQTDMAALLIDNNFVKLPPTPGINEEVWTKLVRPNLCLRVYTSIQGTRSRGNGKDSIKVCLVSKTPSGKITGVGSVKRVHRVKGWAANLQNRLDLWQELLGPQCTCGCWMVARESARGQFWGCSNYPICKITRSV